jgi:hypothetical protein
MEIRRGRWQIWQPGVKSQYLVPIGLGSVSGILVPSLRPPSPAPSSPLSHESSMVRAMKVRRGKGWAGQSGGQESTDSGAKGRQLAGTRLRMFLVHGGSASAVPPCGTAAALLISRQVSQGREGEGGGQRSACDRELARPRPRPGADVSVGPPALGRNGRRDGGLGSRRGSKVNSVGAKGQ